MLLLQCKVKKKFLIKPFSLYCFPSFVGTSIATSGLQHTPPPMQGKQINHSVFGHFLLFFFFKMATLNSWRPLTLRIIFLSKVEQTEKKRKTTSLPLEQEERSP